MDILPEDRSPLAKSNPDVCKWQLFVSNLPEDVFHVLKDTFTLDCTRFLKFQAQFDESEIPTVQLLQLPASATYDILKGFLLIFILKNVIHFFEVFTISL